MKAKEYIILGVIIVLLGTYLFLRSNNPSQYQLPTLPDVAADELSRIEISTPGETFELQRSGNQWQIGENAYPMDATKAKEMLSVLEKLKLTALISEARAYSPYDLTDEKKIGVKAWAGDRMVRDFDIGMAAGTYQHTFVRLEDNPNVYHADGNFRQTFDQTVESLRDKTALSFSTSDIKKVDIVYAGKNTSLILENQPAEASPPPEDASEENEAENTEPVWMKDDGTPADVENIQRLLSQLAYLNCSGYLEGKQKQDFSAPVSTITLKGKETYSLSLYEKENSETTCQAVSSLNPYPFTLSETACTRLKETLEKLLGIETDDTGARDTL